MDAKQYKKRQGRCSMIEWIFALLIASSSQDDNSRELKIVPKPIPTFTATPQVQQVDTRDRLTILSEQAGVTVPVVVGFCSTNERVLGCYDTVDNHITITESGMARSDEKLICVLKHEMRHKWQDDQGLIKFDINGNIINLEWIEKDARENGCK